MSVRLYGVSLGHASYARVTAGVRQGLEAHDELAGFVPLDLFDEDESYPGHDAETALVVGPAVQGLQIAKAAGWHKRWLVMVAPNSTWVPVAMTAELARQGAEVVSPSAWGGTVLERAFAAIGYEKQVRVYRHGVDPAFARSEEQEARLDAWYDDEHFRVLHLSSSTFQRKGTRELLVAWHELVADKKLPQGALLEVVYAGAPEQLYAMIPDKMPMKMIAGPPLDLAPAEMAGLYRSAHLVCQPSRGEGFGLVPLEAAASGVCVAATYVTGHTEYLAETRALVIETGDFGPIDDGPGARAPGLEVEAVKRALVDAAETYPLIAKLTREHAERLGQTWSWERVTEDFLASLEASH